MSAILDPIFPGMDPFIEGQRWQEFHTHMISALSDELVRLLVPRYSVQTESYLNIRLRPDITIARGRPGVEPLSPWTLKPDPADSTLTATLAEVDNEQKRIEIRDENGTLVTVLELLSPSNKKQNRPAYLANRDALIQSETNLVELDLLRGGRRMENDLPLEGYVILVCRPQEYGCHACDIYLAGLRDRLPNIPVPLLPEDGDVGISLQSIVERVYRNRFYRLQLDYTKPPDPPITTPDDAAWVEAVLRQAGMRD